MNNTLLQINKERKGKMSHKWESYFHVYEKLFSQLRNKPITIAEIGVLNGGSLELWAEYFINAEKILGVDINQKCSDLVFSNSKIEVVIQDAKIAIPGEYDIIIDDGSHKSEDIINQFKSWFPYLKHDGIYIVEDLHTMWYPNYGTGAEMFFANMIYDINRQFIPNSKFYEIKSIEFYNSLVVVKKGESKLGRKIMCGDELI